MTGRRAIWQSSRLRWALYARSFLIDGEAVVADGQGVASFNLLRGAQAFV
jgi:ATP-dependent DNA ligase